MVGENYTENITDLSRRELQTVFRTVEPPACLLGGWAVHTHVNRGFEEATGREYIGSRDIDIGFHVDTNWSEGEFIDAPVGRSIRSIEELEYSRARFGFSKTFNRETGEVIDEDEIRSVPPHQRFDVHIDIIPDSEDVTVFANTFGFQPPGEPLLRRAFLDSAATPLSNHKQCPSSVSPHVIRRGSITHHLPQDVPEKVVSDRMNVSQDVLDKHYDRRSEETKVEQRRRYLDGV